MPDIKMTLIENSISFFSESIKQAIEAEKKTDHWKFALLLLVQAIETGLKARLRKTHERFIYTNVDKPRHTVDMTLAIQRLQEISEVNFESSDISAIKSASGLRNQIVHFEFDLSIEQIKSNFVTLVGFYISFANTNLDTDVIALIPSQLRRELLNLENYVTELESRAETRINVEDIDQDYLRLCPACGKYTFVVLDQKDICYLCNYEEASLECEVCSAVDIETNMHEVDLGNMKGIESWKIFCSDCFYRISDEYPYHDKY